MHYKNHVICASYLQKFIQIYVWQLDDIPLVSSKIIIGFNVDSISTPLCHQTLNFTFCPGWSFVNR